MTLEQCNKIQDGITYLKEHANATCRMHGDVAQERFDYLADGEGSDGKDYGFYNVAYAYGSAHMTVQWATGPLTYPSDGRTRVHPAFWESPGSASAQSTGALIAHEELHHLDPNFSENDGNALQDICMNPQS